MNAWNNFDKTDSEYSVAPTDDLIRFWRSRSQQVVEVVKASTSMLGHRSTSSSLTYEMYSMLYLPVCAEGVICYECYL